MIQLTCLFLALGGTIEIANHCFDDCEDPLTVTRGRLGVVSLIAGAAGLLACAWGVL